MSTLLLQWVLVASCLLLGGAWGVEVGVPERFLRPRNFNPHPYTDALLHYGGEVGDIDSLPHPYALFQRPDVREGPSSPAPVQFPKVPEVVRAQPTPPPAPRLKPNYIKHTLLPPQENKLAKNYAFSYSVRDHHSGDDFSHSQAHSNHATKGEYRVRLPDGRLQVVSYTADDKGYRADVRYDEEQNAVEEYSAPLRSYKSPQKAAYFFKKPLSRPYTPIHEDFQEVAPPPYFGPSAQPYDYYDEEEERRTQPTPKTPRYYYVS